MRATTLHLVRVGLTAAMISSTANAAAGERSSAAGAGADRMRVGVTLLPMPVGVLQSGGAAAETSVGSVFALAVMASFDLVTYPNAFVGFAPSYAFHIKARGADVAPRQEPPRRRSPAARLRISRARLLIHLRDPGGRRSAGAGDRCARRRPARPHAQSVPRCGARLPGWLPEGPVQSDGEQRESELRPGRRRRRRPHLGSCPGQLTRRRP